MTSLIADLRDLHALLMKLEGVQHEFNQGPKKIAARKRVVAVQQTALEAAREALTNQRMKADEKSLQLKSKENKLSELRAKLNTAASNREFDIIKGQIEADTAANSVLEDEILEAFELVDQSEQEVKKVEQALLEAEQSVINCQLKVDDARPALETSIDDLTKQIKVAEDVLPAEAQTQYRRMVQAYGPKSMAAVTNKACTFCYTSINAQDSVKLNVGKIVFCRSCGRLLYAGDK